MSTQQQIAVGKALRVVQALRLQAKAGRDTAEAIVRWTQIVEFGRAGYLSETVLDVIPSWADSILEEHDIFMDGE